MFPITWASFGMHNGDDQNTVGFRTINDSKRKSPHQALAMTRVDKGKLFRA